METIGLIAGNRHFPLYFAQQAKKKGNRLVAVAIKRDTSARLKKYVEKIYWLDICEFSKAFEIFHSQGIKKVALVGQINPQRLFDKRVREDKRVQSFFGQLGDYKANSIFSLITDKLNQAGFEVLDSHTFMEDFLPKKGNLTDNQPDFSIWQDVYFGLNLAKQVATLDIGLSVAVKQKAIVAVEALEGTDALIRRSGRIAGAGIVIVKVSRPWQDMRFDLPVVGLKTVQNLVKIKARCLAIEAGKTIFLDLSASIALAERFSLAIVAV